VGFGADSGGKDVKNEVRPGTAVRPLLLNYHMTDTPKPDPRPLFTPSTLPQPSAPDPVVLAIEAALLAIANRQEEERTRKPAA
jgi:hypothetical protein